MSSSNPPPSRVEDDPLDEMLPADDAAEEIEAPDDGDAAMDSDPDDDDDDDDPEEGLTLHNDSIAYFDLPPDSLFAIAQHPVHGSLVAVGGSAGREDDAPGAGWLLDTSSASPRPVLPASYANAGTRPPASPTQLESLFALQGHADSINALCWTHPAGGHLVSGGLDGRLQVWKVDVPSREEALVVTPLGDAQEVDEINWLAACPSPDHPAVVALGASDGSVWVYAVEEAAGAAPPPPPRILQSYFLHTGPCTAGTWSPDGRLLVSVSEDGSLYAWDVWGEAAARNMVHENGVTAVALTAADQRFEVEGGLYSVATDPRGTFAAAGGAGGAVKIVSLPRLSSQPAPSRGGRSGVAVSDATSGGQILASLHTQSDSVESLATTLSSDNPPTVLLAAGSVDGSIVVYDATRRFAVRRHITAAHDGHSVVKLDFVKDTWLLTSCGMDGVVRRWDLRGGGNTGADRGLVGEWRGHGGGGEGGGVLGFVQGSTGERIVTAGDDGLALVFEA